MAMGRREEREEGSGASQGGGRERGASQGQGRSWEEGRGESIMILFGKQFFHTTHKLS